MRGLLTLAAVVALAGCSQPASEQTVEAPVETPRAQVSVTPPAALPECRRRFRMVMDKPLQLQEFASLTGPKSVSMDFWGGDRLSLTYRPFDYEEAPIDGERHGVGVFFARDERPGGKVIGGVLWADPGVEMSTSGGFALERNSAQGLFLKLTPLNGLKASTIARPVEEPMRCNSTENARSIWMA